MTDEGARLWEIIAELERQVADLARHNRELREAIDALMRPAPSELLLKNLAHPSRERK
jgi:hypothetical protein